MSLLLSQQYRLHRMPINPMDKCTVVSVYSKGIDETKPTIYPRRFVMEPAPPNDISILVLGPGSWWREIDPEQPPVEIQVNSMQMAKSFIEDYAGGLLGCNMGDCMPGLFYIPGPADQKFATDYTKKDLENLKTVIKAQHKDKIEEARAKQKKWFAELVRIADIDWARTNGNPIAISDDARQAAESLGLKNKAWMQDFTAMEMTNCPACGALRNSMYPICQSCKTVVDKKKFEELGLKQYA